MSDVTHYLYKDNVISATPSYVKDEKRWGIQLNIYNKMGKKMIIKEENKGTGITLNSITFETKEEAKEKCFIVGKWIINKKLYDGKKLDSSKFSIIKDNKNINRPF